jgi:hypothetical protein
MYQPDLEVHATFGEVAADMAKCDGCRDKNMLILYRHTDCPYQLCNDSLNMALEPSASKFRYLSAIYHRITLERHKQLSKSLLPQWETTKKHTKTFN